MKFQSAKKLLSTFFLTSTVFLTASCDSVNELVKMADIKEPSVSLAETNLNKLTFESAEFMLLLDVDNPNPVPIHLAGFDYTLNVDGKTLTNGKQNKGVEISANDRSQIEFPVAVKFADLLKLTKGLTNRDTVTFNAAANVYVNLPLIGQRSIPASYETQLPYPKPPSVSIKNLVVDKLNFTSATINLVLQVNNPNSFDVDITKLHYNLNVDGKPWADSSTTNVAKIAKNGLSNISIPINLDVSSVGKTLYKTLSSSNPLKYQLQGNITLDTSLPLLKNIQLPINQSGTMRLQ